MARRIPQPRAQNHHEEKKPAHHAADSGAVLYVVVNGRPPPALKIRIFFKAVLILCDKAGARAFSLLAMAVDDQGTDLKVSFVFFLAVTIKKSLPHPFPELIPVCILAFNVHPFPAHATVQPGGSRA